jgi:hypothetical protein
VGAVNIFVGDDYGGFGGRGIHSRLA